VNHEEKESLGGGDIEFSASWDRFCLFGFRHSHYGGIVFFISTGAIEIIYIRHTVGMAARPSYWVWSILAALSLATITFVLTKIFNRSIQAREENSPKENV
jgi:hypothetical protein